MFVYYKWRKRELYAKLMNESVLGGGRFYEKERKKKKERKKILFAELTLQKGNLV